VGAGVVGRWIVEKCGGGCGLCGWGGVATGVSLIIGDDGVVALVARSDLDG